MAWRARGAHSRFEFETCRIAGFDPLARLRYRPRFSPPTDGGPHASDLAKILLKLEHTNNRCASATSGCTHLRRSSMEKCVSCQFYDRKSGKEVQRQSRRPMGTMPSHGTHAQSRQHQVLHDRRRLADGARRRLVRRVESARPSRRGAHHRIADHAAGGSDASDADDGAAGRSIDRHRGRVGHRQRPAAYPASEFADARRRGGTRLLPRSRRLQPQQPPPPRRPPRALRASPRSVATTE